MKQDPLLKLINWIIWPSIGALSLTIGLLIVVLYAHLRPAGDIFFSNRQPYEQKVKEMKQPEIIDGVHLATGLVEGEGMHEVITNCTGCHSAKLIIQNRMDETRWRHTIQWMQRTQNLWDLGAKEDVIVKYLAINYAPEKKGRRQRLTNIEWYELKENE